MNSGKEVISENEVNSQNKIHSDNEINSGIELNSDIKVNSEHEKASHFLGKKQTSFLVLQVMIELILNMKKQVNF